MLQKINPQLRALPNHFSIFLLVVCIGLFSACSPTLLQNGEQTISPELMMNQMQKLDQSVLIVGDKFTLSIWDHEELSVGSIYSMQNSHVDAGKWIVVNEKGYAHFPELGALKVAGKNKSQIESDLSTAYAKFIKNPVLSIHIHDRSFTVLGEVNNQGSYPINIESITLIEAIGNAGGLSTEANARSIQIIKKIKDQEYSMTVDLSSKSDKAWHQIPIAYDDVIYIPATKGRSLKRAGAIVAPFAGLAASIAVLLSVKNN